MLTQSAAYDLQSEFLPKKARMHRIVSGEEQPPRNREPMMIRQQQQQCLPEPSSFRPGTGGGSASPALPIPLPSTHIPRTKSELQLAEDMHAAEWRDRCMFQRLVTGIRERNAVLERKQMAAQSFHLAAAAGHQQQRRRSASKLRMSMQGVGVGAAVAVAPVAPPQPNQTFPVVAEVVDKAVVSPYQSLTSSPAAAVTAAPQPAQTLEQVGYPAAAVPPGVTSRQHLQHVLTVASGIATEALADDWSLGGYEQPQPQARTATTTHQSYFAGPPLEAQPQPAQVEDDREELQDEEDDDMADGEIFSLDL